MGEKINHIIDGVWGALFPQPKEAPIPESAQKTTFSGVTRTNTEDFDKPLVGFHTIGGPKYRSGHVSRDNIVSFPDKWVDNTSDRVYTTYTTTGRDVGGLTMILAEDELKELLKAGATLKYEFEAFGETFSAELSENDAVKRAQYMVEVWGSEYDEPFCRYRVRCTYPNTALLVYRMVSLSEEMIRWYRTYDLYHSHELEYQSYDGFVNTWKDEINKHTRHKIVRNV